jgi:UDP-2,3-diacylglucosamine pyrophosphatase LpxH
MSGDKGLLGLLLQLVNFRAILRRQACKGRPEQSPEKHQKNDGQKLGMLHGDTFQRQHTRFGCHFFASTIFTIPSVIFCLRVPRDCFVYIAVV